MSWLNWGAVGRNLLLQTLVHKAVCTNQSVPGCSSADEEEDASGDDSESQGKDVESEARGGENEKGKDGKDESCSAKAHNEGEEDRRARRARWLKMMMTRRRRRSRRTVRRERKDHSWTEKQRSALSIPTDFDHCIAAVGSFLSKTSWPHPEARPTYPRRWK